MNWRIGSRSSQWIPSSDAVVSYMSVENVSRIVLNHDPHIFKLFKTQGLLSDSLVDVEIELYTWLQIRGRHVRLAASLRDVWYPSTADTKGTYMH